MELSALIIFTSGFFALTSFLITIWNWQYLDRLRLCPSNELFGDTDVSITVLIPARNEGKNIGEVLTALSYQTYINYDVIVLNDDSEDDTAEIVDQFLTSDLEIQLIDGESIPKGWLGKNWACHQLMLKADGDYILFIDADTVLHEDTIKAAVNEAIVEKSDLLTMIPARCANNFIERTIYGFIDWAIYAWLPLHLAHLSKNAYLSASYGQFMLFKRESYILSGGHKKIKDVAVDDFGLGRLIKSSGLRWTLKDGTNMVTSLPYNDILETVKGVSRSLAPALNYRISLILLISFFLMGLFFAPVFNLYFYVINGDHFEFLEILSLVTIFLLLGSYLLSCKRFSHSLFVVLFIHVTVIFMILIAYHSLLSNLLRVASWKNRNMVIKKLKF